MPPKKKGPKDATSKSGATTIAEQATCRSAMSTTPNSCAPNIRTGLEEQTANIRGRKRNNSEVSTASKAPIPHIDLQTKQAVIPQQNKTKKAKTAASIIKAPKLSVKLLSRLVKKGMKLVARNIKRCNAGRNTTEEDEEDNSEESNNVSEEDAEQNDDEERARDIGDASRMFDNEAAVVVQRSKRLSRASDAMSVDNDFHLGNPHSNIAASPRSSMDVDDFYDSKDVSEDDMAPATSGSALDNTDRVKAFVEDFVASGFDINSDVFFSHDEDVQDLLLQKLELAYAAAQQEAEEEEDVPKLVRRKNPVSVPRLGKKFDNKKATFPSAMACPGSRQSTKSHVSFASSDVDSDRDINDGDDDREDTSVGPNGFLPYTEIVPGTPHLLISAQTGKVKSTLKLGSTNLGYVGNGHIADRLQRGDQEQYIDPMTLHVHHRFVLAWSSIKAQARHIPAILNIPNTDGGRRIARGLLESFDYVNGTDDSLFGARIILMVLCATYGNGAKSFMGRHSGLLTSSIATGSRASEREVTVLMVALVATGIHAVLSDLGHNTHDEFSGSNMSSVFLRHTTVLEEYKLRKPNSFHKLMHGLYLDATNSMPNATHGMTKAEIIAAVPWGPDDDN
ncbi:hypothetical protein CPB85DRAFT_1262607 [Mucidula mucida]|nr:hypothetical protein CPB85DRAFT_1262607 [Mucidula mucida]